MKVHVTELNVGDRLIANAYNSFGLHILSADTVLRASDISKLLLHRVDYVDIAGTRPKAESADTSAPLTEFYSNAVRQVSKLFEDVRVTGTIDESEVDNSIAPLLDLFQTERDLVSVLLSSVSRDEYTYQHCVQVGSISYFIAQWMGLPEEDCSRIGKAGYLHDIGKCRIPSSVLNKPGRLSDEEYAQVRKHPEYGYQIIQASMDNDLCAKVALEHHERMDGSGYPYGIKGTEIQLASRIVAVADVYSAMICDRAYQKRRHLLDVLRELYRLSFSELDPAVVQVFLRFMMPNFVGKKAHLSNGEEGIVVLIHESDWFRPLVQVNGTYIDLKVRRDLEIQDVSA
ncbi:HD-GYP domain-containing protein [Paenibacillus thermoaerophilus]|nr:HD-GYP domain-containing protein [Paenibacillus thermoaerophilus]